jgi:hypothetical protein
MKLFLLFASVAVATTLIACGGGGSDAPAPAPASSGTDKYVGTWGNCSVAPANPNGVMSVNVMYVLSKNSANAVSFSLDSMGFSGSNCSGNVLTNPKGIATGTITVNGTKIIGSSTVDRIDVSSNSTNPNLNGSYKDVALLAGNQLQFGGAGTADGEGYPNQLDTSFPFTKQ